MTFHQYEFFHEILKVVKKQFFVTMLATEWLLTSMSLLMKLKITSQIEFLVTILTTEGLVAAMTSFMNFQIT